MCCSSAQNTHEKWSQRPRRQPQSFSPFPGVYNARIEELIDYSFAEIHTIGISLGVINATDTVLLLLLLLLVISQSHDRKFNTIIPHL